jgi:DNA-binding NarL/FixJ family response regulator
LKEMSEKITNRSIVTRALIQGREALQNQEWSSAFSFLSEADQKNPLCPEDLEGLANAAYLAGKETESADILARAHQGFLTQGKTQRAVRCAFWLGFMLLIIGESAQAGGWLSRARRLIEREPDCVEKGYLLLPDGFRCIRSGEPAKGFTISVEAAAIGERFGDKDLVTLALQGQGRALIQQGEIARGVALLDEAMVAVTAGEVSSRVAGGIYCSVIEACSEIFDLRRAQEWTTALEKWCSSQPDQIPYRGHCLVRRAEILHVHGEWQHAFTEAKNACERLSPQRAKGTLGAAFYQLAEIHRLRGEFQEAEEAYRESFKWNPTPRSGYAQLRWMQGKLDAAISAIHRVTEEVREPGKRAKALEAYVELLVEANDLPAAHEAAEELTKIADYLNTPFVHAVSAHTIGLVLLAENNAKQALVSLRQSLKRWTALEVPYESARVQVLIGLAYRKLGDKNAADEELNAARNCFQQLGAAWDFARVEKLLNKRSPVAESALTTRETEVLKLVASGMTNRKIAAKLGISEKTVARHVSNIFLKLDLSSRAAATAYAYQHKLA